MNIEQCSLTANYEFNEKIPMFENTHIVVKSEKKINKFSSMQFHCTFFPVYTKAHKGPV